MKLSLPQNGFKKPPILPLFIERNTKEDSRPSTVYHLRTTPADADSPKYKVTIPTLQGDESIRSLINWKHNCQKVIHGLNATTFNTQVAMVETMMEPTPAALFQTHIQTLCTAQRESAALAIPEDDEAGRAAVRAQPLAEHGRVEFILPSLNNVLKHLMPKNALRIIKRYLRRECRKPREMSVRTYLQHLLQYELTMTRFLSYLLSMSTKV